LDALCHAKPYHFGTSDTVIGLFDEILG